MINHRGDQIVSREGRYILSRRKLFALGIGIGGTAIVACSPAPTPAPSAASTAAPGPAKVATPGSAVAAPTAAAKPAASTPAKKLATHLNVAYPDLTTTLDPHAALTGIIRTVRLSYDALVSFDDPGNKIIPQLATEWKRLDPLTMEFKLRDDVKFSNGEPFDAEAVEFSIERIVGSTNPLHASTKAQMLPLVGADVVNSTTVRVRTKVPDPIVLNRLAILFILPPRYTGGGGDVNTKAIGTGSFKVTAYQPGSEIAFEAWDGTWRGKSTVQTIRQVRISEASTMVSGLRAGEVHIAYRVQPDQVAGLKRDGFNAGSVSSSTCTVITVVPGKSRFDDKRAREAMNLAVNKDELLQTVQAGFGIVAPGQTLRPGMFGFQNDIKAIPYDPERARALVREAGLDGVALSITHNANNKGVADAVVGYLNTVGIKARSEPVEQAVLSQALNTTTDRPAIMWDTNYFGIQDFDGTVLRFGPALQQPHFRNEEFNRLYELQRQEMDTAKRAEQIRRMTQIMRDEYAAVFLLIKNDPTVYTRKIATLDLPYDSSLRLWKVEMEA